MELTREQINEILKDFSAARAYNKRVSKSEQDEDFGTWFEVYETKYEGIYLKFEMFADSYGEGELVAGVQIVKPVIKEVTDFE